MKYFNIKHIPKYVLDINGDLYHKKKMVKLKVFKNKGGYVLSYPYIDGVKKTVLHHRLVASVFIDNKENKPQVNHIDGNKENYNPLNLEWCTAAENVSHSINVLGNKNKGGDRPKLNRSIAESVRVEILNSNVSKLSRKYGVSRSSISKILNFKSYK